MLCDCIRSRNASMTKNQNHFLRFPNNYLKGTILNNSILKVLYFYLLFAVF